MDHQRNDTFRKRFNTKPIDYSADENQLRWFGHIKRMVEEKITRKVYEARPIKKEG